MAKKKASSKPSKIKNFFTKRRVILVVIIIVIIAIGYGYWHQTKNGSKYIVEPAQYGSITEVVSETGNITTTGVTPIYSTTTGVVDQVLVQNGDVVAEGQDLFSVQSIATKQEQEAAMATYMAAKSALESAKATQLSVQAGMLGKWDTFRELAESDEYEEGDGTPKTDQRHLPEFQIPEKEWLSAEANYKNQQQIINEKSIAASAAWRAYQATQDGKISAVLGGTVRNLGVTRGDMVTTPVVGIDTSPALVLVDDTVPVIVKVSVNETDAVKINPGQKAEIEFDAIPDESFPARVDRVDTVAPPELGVIKYHTYLVLDKKISRLQRGMTADVNITVSSQDNILTVPSSAVKPYQGGKAVRVVAEDGDIEFIPVTIGSKGGGKTEISSGIEEGTEVIVTLGNDQVERASGFF